MSTPVMIVGESGSGKSTSMRNLNPEETYLILVIDKPLPFRNKYKKSVTTAEGKIPGNLYVSDKYNDIIAAIKYINKNRPEIKNIVIDDFQYIMANEFMRRVNETGYKKFTDLAKNIWEIVCEVHECREDLVVFFLTHSELCQDGKYKAKTVGKMLNDQVTLEGMFTIVLHAMVSQDRWAFLTQNDGSHIAKSPLDMFDEKLIQNDLQYVKQKIDGYYNIDIPQ